VRVRYKVWRSNKDKELHVLCAQGAEAFEASPSVMRITVERWVAPVKSTAHGFRIAQCSCSAPRQNHSLTASTLASSRISC
jgi:hypothetical protein